MEILIAALLIIAFVVYSVFLSVDNIFRRVTEEAFKELREVHGDEQYFSPAEIRAYLLDKPDEIKFRGIWKKLFLWYVGSDRNIRRRCRNSTLLEENVKGGGLFRLKLRDYELPALFDWEDETIYEWRIERKQLKLWQVILLAIGVWLAMIFTFYGIFWLVDLVASLIALIFAAILYAFMAWMQYSLWSFKAEDLDEDQRNNALVYILTGGSFIRLMPPAVMTGTLLFVLASEYTNLDAYFTGDLDAKLSWILYAAERTSNELFYDIVDVIGGSIPGIEATNWVGRLLATIIKFHLIYSGVAIVIYVYRVFTERTEIFSGTIKACYTKLSLSMNDFEEEKIYCMGKLLRPEEEVAFTKTKLMDAYREDYDSDAGRVAPHV